LGGIDILVNNAGITATCPFAEVTDTLFDTLFAVNVKAMYFMTQRIAQGMAAIGGGVVVNLASLHAWFGVREHSLYAATKGAIVSLTSQLAVELAPLGIRVNAVAPGTCVGENQRAADPTHAGVDAPHLPAGYYSVPADVGRLVVFLAGPQADYFVGQTLRFDGGYSVLFPTMPDFRVPLPARQGGRYLDRG
ncbi:MAG: SDR family oxidoreductase, partial [Planctomycetes bacterium]|nr:SDR family oxidoreductase [Planctomycetota bacterium]